MSSLDEEMTQCYLNRYDDIKPVDDQTLEEAAQEHWFRWGYFEGRHPYCAKKITAYQSKCYL